MLMALWHRRGNHSGGGGRGREVVYIYISNSVATIKIVSFHTPFVLNIFQNQKYLMNARQKRYFTILYDVSINDRLGLRIEIDFNCACSVQLL